MAYSVFPSFHHLPKRLPSKKGIISACERQSRWRDAIQLLQVGGAEIQVNLLGSSGCSCKTWGAQNAPKKPQCGDLGFVER